jgi:hypothetical protein
MSMPAAGTSRHFGFAQRLGRLRSEADINRPVYACAPSQKHLQRESSAPS